MIKDVTHRPWSVPERPWIWYQEWNRALFLHWKVPVSLLRPLVPEQLQVDTCDNSAWISLVPFTMERIRPRCLPSVPMISNFHEVNLRTYVTDGTKAGVYFLNIQAGNALSAWIAKTASGLPYEVAKILRSKNERGSLYEMSNERASIRMSVEYKVGDSIQNKSELDRWLTERYCLYLSSDNKFSRYEIHHGEWPLSKVRIEKLDLNYSVGNFQLAASPPDFVHYSPGIQVLAWPRETLHASKISS